MEVGDYPIVLYALIYSHTVRQLFRRTGSPATALGEPRRAYNPGSREWPALQEFRDRPG